MAKTKTVRVSFETVAKMKEVRSPGETDPQLLDRAISLLAEVKDITSRFCESPEYQAWLASHKEVQHEIR